MLYGNRTIDFETDKTTTMNYGSGTVVRIARGQILSKGEGGGQTMAIMEREPTTGVCAESPWVQGQSHGNTDVLVQNKAAFLMAHVVYAHNSDIG